MPTTNVVIPNMVKGPASATDDTFVKYDGTTGKLLKDGVAGSDGGNGAADGGKVALFKSTGALEGRCTVSFGVKGTSVSGVGVDGRSELVGVYGLGEADGVGVSGNSLGAGAGVSSSVTGTGPMFFALNEDADQFQVDHDGALEWSGPGAATAVATTRTNLGLGALAVKDTVATADIDNDTVTNANLANMEQGTVKGRGISAGNGDPQDLGPDDISNILDTASDPFARTSALGTIASQSASNVSITGGSVTGITDLAVADGGTGASTAAGARSNLGVAIDQIDFFIPVPINGTVTLRLNAKYAFTVDNMSIKTTSGTITAALQIDGTPVTSISAVSVTSTEQTVTATGANSAALGTTLNLVLTSNASAANLSGSVQITRA